MQTGMSPSLRAAHPRKAGTSAHVLSAVDELPILSIETREHVPADLEEIMSWSLVPRVHVLPVSDDPEVPRI